MQPRLLIKPTSSQLLPSSAALTSSVSMSGSWMSASSPKAAHSTLRVPISRMGGQGHDALFSDQRARFARSLVEGVAGENIA
jgi:hypothetical protein